MNGQGRTPELDGTMWAADADAACATIREEIRDAATRRRDRGELPTEEELDRLQAEIWIDVNLMTALAARPSASPDVDFVPAIPIDPRFTVEECEILPADYRIDWRHPIVGQAHATLRRQINAEVRRYVDAPLARQTRLNYRLTELLQTIVRDHSAALDRLQQQLVRAESLRIELDGLRAELHAVRAELHATHAEAATAREYLNGLRAGARLHERAADQAANAAARLPLDYLAYNERIGGGIEHERALYAEFLDLFADAAGPVLDLGCGRGQFLDILRDAGPRGIGVDSDPAIVACTRTRGHRVIETDVLAFLESVEDASLGGIFAAHLVEHLPRPALIAFVAGCRRALLPGASAVFITPDPRSLFVLSDTFYKDLTHVAPIHPAALSFLAEQAGFAASEVRTLSPVPEALRLEGEDSPGSWSPALRRNLAKLEELLFGDMDYALIARR
jgi:SAM-dependent methyltransferase